MKIRISDRYFFKLKDGSIITGLIVEKDDSLGHMMIVVNDKYNNLVGFRADEIIKYEQFNPEKSLKKMNEQKLTGKNGVEKC